MTSVDRLASIVGSTATQRYGSLKLFVSSPTGESPLCVKDAGKGRPRQYSAWTVYIPTYGTFRAAADDGTDGNNSNNGSVAVRFSAALLREEWELEEGEMEWCALALACSQQAGKQARFEADWIAY